MNTETKFPVKKIAILFFCLSVASAQEAVLKDITELPSCFEMDVRYATDDNFMNEVLYPCAKCLLLPQVAEALHRANLFFIARGYRLVIYDCYRPLDVQRQMFAKVPNPIYVADPAKGSVHNRGGAVDVSLVTLGGCPVDIGTDYDFFGRKAHTDFYGFSQEVLDNRTLLQEGMLAQGFRTIQSEWWHFNHVSAVSHPVMNEPLGCE